MNTDLGFEMPTNEDMGVGQKESKEGLMQRFEPIAPFGEEQQDSGVKKESGFVMPSMIEDGLDEPSKQQHYINEHNNTQHAECLAVLTTLATTQARLVDAQYDFDIALKRAVEYGLRKEIKPKATVNEILHHENLKRELPDSSLLPSKTVDQRLLIKAGMPESWATIIKEQLEIERIDQALHWAEQNDGDWTKLDQIGGQRKSRINQIIGYRKN